MLARGTTQAGRKYAAIITRYFATIFVTRFELSDIARNVTTKIHDGVIQSFRALDNRPSIVVVSRAVNRGDIVTREIIRIVILSLIISIDTQMWQLSRDECEKVRSIYALTSIRRF